MRCLRCNRVARKEKGTLVSKYGMTNFCPWCHFEWVEIEDGIEYRIKYDSSDRGEWKIMPAGCLGIFGEMSADTVMYARR